jgi:hypothetical protein
MVVMRTKVLYCTLDLNNKLELEIESYHLFVLLTWIIPNDFYLWQDRKAVSYELYVSNCEQSTTHYFILKLKLNNVDLRTCRSVPLCTYAALYYYVYFLYTIWSRVTYFISY